MNELLDLLRQHLALYPEATVQDAVKFLYQNEFGGGHLISGPQAALQWLTEEMATCAKRDAPLAEPIGNGSVRLNLFPASGRISPETLFRVFFLSSSHVRGGVESFRAKLSLLYDLPFHREEVERFLAEYERAGFPMVSHSGAYRAAYAPAYRVVDEEYARFFDVLSAIDRLSRFAGPVVVGIDGMCASGKSTLGKLLAEVFEGNLFHADDYFLPPEKRTPERLSEPGGNMDRERLKREVLEPLASHNACVTRRFDCGALSLEPPIAHPKRRVNIVEGSYSLHPELRDFYTLKLALRALPGTQLARLKKRDPALLSDFQTRWIPMENRYFEAMDVFESADMVIET